VGRLVASSNKADEPDGKNYAVLRKGCATLKAMRPAGYPQALYSLASKKVLQPDT
jgi:hypothetical protein